jgi:3-methyladenine DNA glycosylase/8-oxoguanine DNA glycosylase
VEVPLERRMRLEQPIDLRRTVGPLTHGGIGPCGRFDGDRFWRATRTPCGPATTCLRVEAATGEVHGRAWGPGAAWFLDSLPQQVGVGDDHEPLRAMLEALPPRPAAELLRTLHRRSPGMRLACTGTVVEHLLPTVVEQRVTSREAHRSWVRLVRRYGDPAPGPAAALGLLLPPDPVRIAAMPYYAVHRMGIERNRAETLRRVGAAADRLEPLAAGSLDDAHRGMQRLRGVGRWSSALVALTALGDADAVPVGDFHIKNHVAWSLAGEARGTDERMLELLEPYRGQRGRVVRLVMTSGLAPPKFGPRQRVIDFRAS